MSLTASLVTTSEMQQCFNVMCISSIYKMFSVSVSLLYSVGNNTYYYYYLGQCWLIDNWTLMHRLHGYLYEISLPPPPKKKKKTQKNPKKTKHTHTRRSLEKCHPATHCDFQIKNTKQYSDNVLTYWIVNGGLIKSMPVEINQYSIAWLHGWSICILTLCAW